MKVRHSLTKVISNNGTVFTVVIGKMISTVLWKRGKCCWQNKKGTIKGTNNMLHFSLLTATITWHLKFLKKY